MPEEEPQKTEEEIVGAKLKESLAAALAAPSLSGANDYFTPEEMTKFKKPKKKKIRTRERVSFLHFFKKKKIFIRSVAVIENFKCLLLNCCGGVFSLLHSFVNSLLFF